ncbi:CFAP45 family protein [Megaselia abdita]
MNCKKTPFVHKRHGPKTDLPPQLPECQNTEVLIVQKCKHEKRLPVVRLPCPRYITTDEHIRQMESGNCKIDHAARKPRIYPTLIKKHEFGRLKEAENLQSLEEKVEALKKYEEEQEMIRAESDKRKQFFRDIDNERLKRQMEVDKNKVLDSEISEAKLEKAQILEKSFIARFENEEEVKMANRIILNAKCSIIRKIQLEEKFQMKKEVKDEDMKCDNSMLEKTQASLVSEEAKEEIAKQKAIENAKYIKKQLNEKYLERCLEHERLQEEAKLVAKAAEIFQKEEERKAQLQRERKVKTANDLGKIKEYKNHFKQLANDQDKELDKRISCYLKRKNDRESAFQHQKKLEKEVKMKKIQNLFDTQKRALDSKQDNLEIVLARDQDLADREFRRKEKEAVLKRQRVQEAVSVSRQAQMRQNKERQAQAMAREEEDFWKLIKTLESLKEEDQAKEDKKVINKKKYKEEIVKQMNEKECERREQLEKTRKELLTTKEREDERRNNIRSVIDIKFNTLAAGNYPQRNIKEVEKKLTRILNT